MKNNYFSFYSSHLYLLNWFFMLKYLKKYFSYKTTIEKSQLMTY